jgi:hypothetical protein
LLKVEVTAVGAVENKAQRQTIKDIFLGRLRNLKHILKYFILLSDVVVAFKMINEVPFSVFA